MVLPTYRYILVQLSLTDPYEVDMLRIMVTEKNIYC